MDSARTRVWGKQLAALAIIALYASGCGGRSANPPAVSGTAAPPSAATAAASPSVAGTETPPPGDIPDTTVYVAYRPASGQYEVKVPEGWARTASPAGVSFTDKLNTISIRTASATAPSIASARTTEVPAIQRSLHGFALSGVSTIGRPAGSAVLIRYSADSQPDPVTGRIYRDVFERYEFFKNGTEVIVSLSGPAGADNVDPWRTVTESFRWLR
jgi:hypothetical protein